MGTRDLTLSMKLYADTARFVSGLVNGERGVRSFTGNVKREFEALKGTLNTVEGKLASLGVSVGAVAAIAQSARMDKSLTQIGQTAGVAEADVANLRKELFRMGRETGQSVDNLQQGFNNAVQAGLNFTEALPVIDATNKAMAVTGASADSLTSALTVASTAFKFDLARPGQALDLLDKMTVAGRLGNAELEGLSGIFSRIGVNAAAAGFDIDKTLSFIEGLSQIERQPERLGTLADSTLRLFTNTNYMKEAAKATGVTFFDKKGAQRDGLEILADIKKQYDKLMTDKERTIFMSRAFGKADLDTIKGLRAIFGTDTLGKMSGEFATKIKGASGTIVRDVPKAIENSIDQVGRLKAALREAADGFAGPINDAVDGSIRLLMNKKENGGLGLDGKDMLLGGTALTLGTLATARYGGKALSNRFGSVGVGVATGKALETAAGVTPVFVVNMPGEGIAGSGLNVPAGIGKDTLVKGVSAASKFRVGAALLGGSDLAAIRMMGAGALGSAALGVGAAGAAGYAAGTGISAFGGWMAKGTRMEGFQTDVIGAISASVAAIFSEEARNAIAINKQIAGSNQSVDLGGRTDIFVHDERITVKSKPNDSRIAFNVHTGRYMAGGG